MSGERLLLDTSFIQAVLSRHDQRHQQAMTLLKRVEEAAEIIVSEYVLTELANGMCSIDRLGAARWIEGCQETENTRVIATSSELFGAGLSLYAGRSDKSWSLTDCTSFLIMWKEGLSIALTSDRHFLQAGFRALMLEGD